MRPRYVCTRLPYKSKRAFKWTSHVKVNMAGMVLGGIKTNLQASKMHQPEQSINPADRRNANNQLKIGPIPHFKAIYLASKSGWEKVSLISCHRHISLHSSAHPLPLGIYAGPCHYQLPHPTLKKKTYITILQNLNITRHFIQHDWKITQSQKLPENWTYLSIPLGWSTITDWIVNWMSNNMKKLSLR